MDDFYAARSSSMPPLPWPNFSPPFSSRGFLALEFVMIPVIGALAGPREILPLIGGVTFSTGVAFLSGTRLTLAILAGEGIWLSYAIWTGATFGVLAALGVMTALLVRTLRRWLARSAP